MNHKIIFTEDKMYVNGTKVKDYKKSLPKEYEMMGAIKAITLDNVLLQENGILRDENGLLIARLVDSVKFDDIENSLKKENEMMDAIKLADGLLSCPFCGGKAKFYKDENRDGIGIYVKCIDCGTNGKLFSEWTWEKTMGSFDQTNSELKALEWWNKRGVK